MGVTSIGRSSKELDDRDVTDEEVNQPNKPLTRSAPRLDPDSGVGESSRGFGSASLLEVLKTQRITRLEASQGAIGSYELSRTRNIEPHARFSSPNIRAFRHNQSGR